MGWAATTHFWPSTRLPDQVGVTVTPLLPTVSGVAVVSVTAVVAGPPTVTSSGVMSTLAVPEAPPVDTVIV